LDAALTCPNDIKGKEGGVVFLIHGAGTTAVDSWQTGPYNLILPGLGPGYDVCWVELSGKALGNAATSAEYVAYGIKKYAKQSKTGKVFVIGHSQGGGILIPWISRLLTFSRAHRKMLLDLSLCVVISTVSCLPTHFV
jgi:alpha-beta hydrolase superfamily lysophospholipase